MAKLRPALLLLFILHPSSLILSADQLEPIQYNNPGLVVDLGVGLWAWPLPMDYDRDGDLDLVVSCPDKPSNGTYFFENNGPWKYDGKRRIYGQHPPASDLRPTKLPVFKPGVRIANGLTNVQVSYVNGEPVVMTPGKIYVDFREHQYDNPIQLPLPEKIDPQYKRYRANQWKLVDWEGDGDLDVIIGIGIWDDYGWDDAWDENGNWKNGPLHGFVYLVENKAKSGTEDSGTRIQDSGKTEGKRLADDAKWPELLGPRPVFAAAVKVEAGGKPVDVYGMPSPNFADFDNDGDLDLICGEFLDGFTWFENTWQREDPIYAAGKRLGSVKPVDPNDQSSAAAIGARGIRMDLQMITPVAIDWDSDGDMDLICGDEDGRVAFIERLSEVERLPQATKIGLEIGRLQSPSFSELAYFQQQALDVKFGALVTPFSIDWDGDGDEDLICGNSAGYIGLVENLGGRWARPRPVGTYFCLSATCGLCSQYPIRHSAGNSGSIQGPCEAKWGYTVPCVADWNHDGQLDVVTNDIWGKVALYQFDPAEAVESLIFHWIVVDWRRDLPKPEWVWWTPEPGTLTTQWRTTPCVLDWNKDGLNDLIMLDHEGYLAFYERKLDPEKRATGSRPPSPIADFRLLPPKRIFKIEGPCEFDQRHRPVGDKKDGLLRLNANRAGASGRRKFCFTDWDGDGRLDLLVNSVNVNWLKNVRTDDEGFVWFKDMGQLDDRVLAGHTTSPTVVDWDKNGIPDLLVGAEDGRLYYKRNPRAAN